jgi:hypothetical protein
MGISSQIAVFCTQGGSGSDKAQAEIESLSGKNSRALLSLNTKEVLENKFEAKIEEFVVKLI